MKKKLIIISILLMGTVVFSQNKNQRATLKVDGVCLMCKNRIEKACIKTKGVKSAVWNVKTHELKLIFDERKTNIQTIEKSVLAVGHDIEKLKATDKAYQGIHDCCKYRDEEIIDDHN